MRRGFDATIGDLLASYTARGNRIGLAIALPGRGEPIAHDADDELPTASLYKLFVLWQVQVAIADGRLADDQALTYCPADDDSYEDNEQLGTYGERFSVAQLRELMIAQSNNTATWILANRLGWANIDAAIQARGFPRTSTIAGISTPREIAAYFRALLAGSLDARLRPPDYALMLDLLKAQRINHLLPAGLPLGTIIAHKTGSLPGVLNDAGIVFLPDGRGVLIVAMTIGDEDASAALLRTLAALIWAEATHP